MMTVRHPAAGLAIVGLLTIGPTAAAQTAQEGTEYAAPAHIAVVDGVAMIERQGVAEAATANVPLLAGDRLRTERGRLEVLFADGSALDLDQFTTVAVPSDTLLTVLTGRVRLAIDGSSPDEAVTYRIDTPGGSVDIRTVGEFRVAIREGADVAEVELAVVRGQADLVTDHGSVRVRAGERAIARANAPPSMPYLYNAATWDAFDRWSEDRRNARLGATSSAYLPSDLDQYGGTFDRYGSWETNPAYGYVWYPAVDVGWRPYYHGHWNFFASFGWTWIGYDAWSWPTHHYGRWGISAGRWYWVPGRHWGPAWVSWASTPAYVAWCPLGYDGYPVIGFSAYWGGGAYGARRHHPWTVLPARHFGRPGRAVAAHAVPVTSIDRATLGRFAERRPAGLAAPRSAAIVSAGARANRAVPRDGAPNRAVPRAGAGDRAQTTRGLATSAGPANGSTRQIAAPRTSTSGRAALGTIASQTTRARTAAEGSPSRAIRIVGQPRPAARGASDADGTSVAGDPDSRGSRPERGTIEGPARQRPPSAASTAPDASRAVPRAGLAAPDTTSGARATAGRPAAPDRPAALGPTRRPSARGSDAPATPRGGVRAPTAVPERSGTTSAPPSRSRSTSGIRTPSAPSAPPRPSGGMRAPSVSSRPSGRTQAPPVSSRPSGAMRAPSVSSRPSGGMRAPSAPSRPSGGMRAPSAPSRSPGARSPSSGGPAPTTSRGSSGSRAAPRAAAPAGRPGGGGRPRGGSE